MSERDPQDIADAVGRHLHEGDIAVDIMGMRLAEIAPGRAVMRMTVTKAMLNANGICHGGLVFALGDTVLAYAACSHGPRTVSQQANVNWVKGAVEGDVLTATCTEVSRAGKSGVYDVDIANQRGERVAVLRCLSLAIGSTAYDPADL
jgi:acyl-CoA thioesterase